MINLTDRELKLLKFLITLVIIIVAYFVIISPVISYKLNLEKDYEINVSRLNNLDNLYEKYIEISHQKDYFMNLLKNNEGVTTLIENFSKETNILKNKVYTRDNPSIIQNKFKKTSTDVKFESVDMKSVLTFIYKLENSNKILKITDLRVQQAIKGKNTFDVTIKIDSYTPHLAQ